MHPKSKCPAHVCKFILTYWFVANQLVLPEIKFGKFILKLLPMCRMDNATEESQLCSCPQTWTLVFKAATGARHTCPPCPVKKIFTQQAEMQHAHYFRDLEIKNCNIEILLTQRQISQLNPHLLVTEETREATSQSAAHHSRLEVLCIVLSPKNFPFKCKIGEMIYLDLTKLCRFEYWRLPKAAIKSGKTWK